MIICLVENCASWVCHCEAYLIDTSLLTSEPLRSFLESAEDSLYVDGDGEFGLCTSEKQGWSGQYELDIQRAMVNPPTLVEKLVSIIFE